MGSVVSGILSGYITDYVHGLSSSVSLWNGSLDAKDVVLNPKLIEALNLPLRMTGGKVGRLSVQIPWTSLGSSPTIIELEDCYIDVSPTLCPEEYGKWRGTLLANKLANLKKLEEQRFARYDKIFNGSSPADSSSSSGSQSVPSASYTYSIVRGMLSNVKVRVKNVVVTYRNSLTSRHKEQQPEEQHSFCLKVNSIEVSAEPAPNLGEGGTRTSVSLSGSSIRYSRSATAAAASSDVKERKGRMGGHGVDGNDMIVEPLAIEVNMEQSKRSAGGPTKVKATCDISPLRLNVNEDVVDYLDTLVSYMQRDMYRPKHAILPSTTTVGGDEVSADDDDGDDDDDSDNAGDTQARKRRRTKAWWRYAVSQIIRERIHRLKREDPWLALIEKIRERKEYIRLHQFRIRTGTSALGTEGLSQAQLSALESLERELPTHRILLYRIQGEAELKGLSAATFSKEALDPKPAVSASSQESWSSYASSYLSSGWLYGRRDFREEFEAKDTTSARRKLSSSSSLGIKGEESKAVQRYDYRGQSRSSSGIGTLIGTCALRLAA
eukprot:jgi/Bigna1/141843/aug1.65_g16551